MSTTTIYKPRLFWFVAITASWVCWLISALISTYNARHPLVTWFYFLGILSPLITTLFFIFGSKNYKLKKDFKDRLFNLHRINPHYLIFTIGIPPFLMLISIAISLLFGQSIHQLSFSGSSAQLLPMIFLTMFIAPLIEETAWRGYGMDSLRAKFNMLSATLLFGLLWSMWHLPLVLIKGTYHYQLAHMNTYLYLANFFLSVMIISVLVSWLYYKHNRSIIAGILLHSILNASAVLIATTQFTKCINSCLYLIVAITIVLMDKKMFAEGPRDFLLS